MNGRRTLAVAAAAILTLGAAPRFAEAQGALPATTQPVVIDSARTRSPKSFMSIDDLSLELGVGVEGGRRTVRTDRTDWWDRRAYGQRDESVRVDETLGLQGSGSIVSDRLIKYEVMTRGGLSQGSYHESRPGPDLSESPHGQLLEYDLRLQALPAGKVSVNAFASKLDDRIPRPFLPSLDRSRERYGAELTYNDAKLPMSLSFEHLFDEMTSHDPFLKDEQEQGEDTLRYEATWQPVENHSLKFDYEYQNQDEQYSGTRSHFHNRGNYLSLLDTVQFGTDGRSRLETLARLQDESGDWAQDAYEFAPRLTLQHSDSLSTNYGFQWLKESFVQLRATTVRGDVGLTHQFQQLLTSTFNLYGLRQDSNDNADIQEWGSLANFAVSKENPLGLFSSNLSYVHTGMQTNDGRRDGVVIRESVTFRDPLPSVLAHSDVVPWSIVVMDPQRFQVFLPVRDYLIVPLGRMTALIRVPTGLIADRQTVAVSYGYRIINNYALQRDRVDWRIQQDFKAGWTPYYAASLQHEDLTNSRYLLWDDRNINRQRIGVTYRKPRWSAGAEYEYNDDSVDPYQAFHSNGDVVLMQSARHQLNGRGNLSRFFFKGQEALYGFGSVPWFELGDLQDRGAHDTTMIDLGMNYRYLVGRNLEAGGTAAYRFQDDTQFGRTIGVDLRGSVAYKLGLLTVLFEIEYETLHLPGSLDDGFAFWVKFRREIPVIGGQRS